MTTGKITSISQGKCVIKFRTQLVAQCRKSTKVGVRMGWEHRDGPGKINREKQ